MFAIGAVVLYLLTRVEFDDRTTTWISVAAQAFDSVVVASYVLAFSFETGTPVPQALFLPLIAACVRFRLLGGLIVAGASAVVFSVYEELRSQRFGGSYRWDYVTLQVGLQLLIALIVGWLVDRLARQTVRAEARAAEAEALRDELGRRSDLFDAANRCARALASSLDLDEAFGAFIRELRGLLPFERASILLVEDGEVRVLAAAGAGADTILPPGHRTVFEGSILEDVLASTRPIYRPELDPAVYPGEAPLVELGLGSRVAAPLLAGPRAIGMLALTRGEPRAFTEAEIELLGLLGRLVATAVQNIAAYDAERRTVEELRRVSTLRSEFVSLVSHELRTPLAAVLGAARTLRQRAPDLTPEQRKTFVEIISDEAERLGTLVGEVLDTSRIDAGTFSYSFADVDAGALVREAATAASTGHGAKVVTRVPDGLPAVRGDRGRLRQVLANLIDNAIKYSPDGEPVEVRVNRLAGTLAIDVIDSGAGIAGEDQRAIFEKFGRVRGTASKPGAGLGLYIARAIAEAHGGSLSVTSTPGRGSTFTLSLPLE